MGKKKTVKARVIAIFVYIAAIFAFILTVVQLKEYFFETDESIELYVHDVSFTYPSNYRFIKFLESAKGKIVYIDSRIDSSISVNLQARLEMMCGHEEEIFDGKIFNKYIALPHYSDLDFNLIEDIKEPLVDEDTNELNPKIGCGYYKIYIEGDSNRGLMASHGGTGIITFDLEGFYLVNVRNLSGPSLVFNLKEYDAPVDIRSTYLSEAKEKKENLMKKGEVFDPES